MSQDYRNDEIRAYVNRLYDFGARGATDSFNGMSITDEAHLTALIIQATPFLELPKLDLLDHHQGLYLMISRYIDNQSPLNALDLANYIKNLLVDHYQEKVKKLMEDVIHERELEAKIQG